MGSSHLFAVDLLFDFYLTTALLDNTAGYQFVQASL